MENIGLDRCEFCNSPAHHWFDCKLKPSGWKPERLKKSTAARKDVPVQARRQLEPRETPRGEIQLAGTQAPPVEPILGKRRGRPQTITDMKAYKAQKERERRAKAKLK
jgi:hypothetical protein